MSYVARREFMTSALGVSSLGLTNPASLRAGSPVTGWVKSPRNPMLSLGSGNDFDSQNLFAPAIAREAGRYFLFYSGGPAGPRTGEELVRYQLGLALSADGVTWEKRRRPLLPLGERDNFHCTPALLRAPTGALQKRDGQWHLVYCGNRADDVEHATSPDGLSWQKDPRNPIFSRAYAPSLLLVNDELWMYYVHKPPRQQGRPVPWEIHLASGPDFTALKPHRANPVLALSQPWESAHLFYPYVLKEGNTWVMFYASYWTGRPQSTAIGMVTSADGLKWSKHETNPVLTPTPGSTFDSTYTSSQSVLRDGDHYKMYYGARINQIHKYYAIGLATYRGLLIGG